MLTSGCRPLVQNLVILRAFGRVTKPHPTPLAWEKEPVTEPPKAAAKCIDVITWLALTSVLIATSKLTTPFCPLGQSCGHRRSAQQRSHLGYESRAITLSAALTSDAAWDGDNTPEPSKSLTSLMKESRFPIAPAFFPAFIRPIACCSCFTSELS